MHHTRHHQRDQAGPQQWDIGVIVGTGSQHGHQFGVGGFFDPGAIAFHDLALLVFSQHVGWLHALLVIVIAPPDAPPPPKPPPPPRKTAAATATAPTAASTAAEDREQGIAPTGRPRRLHNHNTPISRTNKPMENPGLSLAKLASATWAGTGQRLTAHHLDRVAYAVADTLAEIAGLELGCNHLADDHPGLRIGQRTFQAVTDFDA